MSPAHLSLGMFVFVFFRTVTEISCSQSQPRILSSFCLLGDVPPLPVSASVGLNGSWSISFFVFAPFSLSPLLLLPAPCFVFLSYRWNVLTLHEHAGIIVKSAHDSGGYLFHVTPKNTDMLHKMCHKVKRCSDRTLWLFY